MTFFFLMTMLTDSDENWSKTKKWDENLFGLFALQLLQ